MSNGIARLKAWMKRAQLNQTDAARELGVDKTSLNHLLTGRRSPGLRTAHRIEDKTGIATEVWLPVPVGADDLTDSKNGRKR